MIDDYVDYPPAALMRKYRELEREHERLKAAIDRWISIVPFGITSETRDAWAGVLKAMGKDQSAYHRRGVQGGESW